MPAYLTMHTTDTNSQVWTVCSCGWKSQVHDVPLGATSRKALEAACNEGQAHIRAVHYSGAKT